MEEQKQFKAELLLRFSQIADREVESYAQAVSLYQDNPKLFRGIWVGIDQALGMPENVHNPFSYKHFKTTIATKHSPLKVKCPKEKVDKLAQVAVAEICRCTLDIQ